MPKTIKPLLTFVASGKPLREFAKRVTKQWTDARPKSSPEHISKKGFTRAELINLAMIERQADDIQFAELRSHGFMLPFPGPGGWAPCPYIWAGIQALYRERGYILGFLQHVRKCMAPDDGFTPNPITEILERHPDKKTGKIKGTPSVIGARIASPAFAKHMLAKYPNPGIKDMENELKGKFSLSKSTIAEANRRVKRKR